VHVRLFVRACVRVRARLGGLDRLRLRSRLLLPEMVSAIFLACFAPCALRIRKPRRFADMAGRSLPGSASVAGSASAGRSASTGCSASVAGSASTGRSASVPNVARFLARFPARSRPRALPAVLVGLCLPSSSWRWAARAGWLGGLGLVAALGCSAWVTGSASASGLAWVAGSASVVSPRHAAQRGPGSNPVGVALIAQRMT